jgi:hypothetical protein
MGLHFHAEHRFSGTVKSVVEVLADRDFYVGLPSPT